MADPLSITASIIAVVTAGLAIAKGLNQIVDDMGSAGQEVRIYAVDIRAMTSVLQGIGEILEKKPRQSWSKAESVIEDILNLCKNILNPINEIQAALVPLLERYKNSNKKLRQVRARVWWFFKYKDKMLSYRQSLQNLNMSLNTHLTAMKLNTADNVTINISVQQSSLQLYLAEAERVLHNRTQPQLMNDASYQGRAIANSSNHTGQSSSTANDAMHTRRPYTREPDITSLDDDADAEQQEPNPRQAEDISQALILYPVGEDDLDEDADGLDVDEVAEVESTILGTLERTSDSSVQEIWEDLGSVLRKVVRYAQEVHQASQEPPPQAAPRNPATEVHPRSLRDEDVRVVSRDGSLARSTGDTSAAHVSIQANDQLLKLKNIDGRTYIFPYERVRTWNDAKAAIFSLRFPKFERPFDRYSSTGDWIDNPRSPSDWRDTTVQEIFVKGFYTLVGPDGDLILPQFWSHTVQPGWTVELQFDELIDWRDKPRGRKEQADKAMAAAPRDPFIEQSRNKISRFFRR